MSVDVPPWSYGADAVALLEQDEQTVIDNHEAVLRLKAAAEKGNACAQYWHSHCLPLALELNKIWKEQTFIFNDQPILVLLLLNILLRLLSLTDQSSGKSLEIVLNG
jgi:hypothetical protein